MKTEVKKMIRYLSTLAKATSGLTLFLEFLRYVAIAALLGLIAFCATAIFGTLPVSLMVFGVVAASLIVVAFVRTVLAAVTVHKTINLAQHLTEQALESETSHQVISDLKSVKNNEGSVSLQQDPAYASQSSRDRFFAYNDLSCKMEEIPTAIVLPIQPSF